MRATFRFRIRLILAGVCIVALLIVVRLYFVQVIHGDDYALKADHQYVSASALFDRGSIYFTRKDGTLVSAATLASGFLVAINPKLLTEPQKVYDALSAISSSTVEHDAFFKAAANKQAVYVEVAHHLSEAEGSSLVEKKFKGVQLLRERWRVYPGSTLAAQTIGVVAQQADDETLKGRTGLESTYDAALTRDGDALYKNFFAELFSNLGNAVLDARSVHAGDVVTSLEPQVETRLAEELQKVSQKYSSKESGGIIMDPHTGAIYAIASYPSYDANNFGSANQRMLTNPAVGSIYEFGSIMKALTMASALDAGVVTPATTYNDTGCLTLDTSTICNYDHKARGVIPMQQILSQSLNMGAAYLADKLGHDRFRNYFTRLGFGEETGIDLPAETSGLIRNLNSPRAIEYATASFGQGIAVTPVEMIRALATLGNGGLLVRPHIVTAIQLDSGITKTLDWTPSPQGQVFSPEAVRATSKMLTSVVDHSLAKGAVVIPTMSVAAKTGTAELVNPAGGYYDNRFFHSFFGYFPSYDPRFIILLYTNDPQNVEYASETLTTTFMNLTHFLINYYNLPPDRVAPPAL